MTSRVVSLSVVLLTVAGTAPTQSIPIQTVPIVPADQFDMFPSYTLAMGGVSIAVPDTLDDPFMNTDTGSQLRGGRCLDCPNFYSVSYDSGYRRAMPCGVVSAAGPWYSGLPTALRREDVR